MANKKNAILIVLLIVGFIITSYSLVKMTNTKIQPVTAYRYARDIDGTNLNPAEKTIDEDDIITVTIPKGAIDDNFITDKSEIIGKKVNCYVYANTYVYKNQIASEDTGIFDELYASTDITKLRTVTVAFELPNALAGNINPGDRVDLLYCDTGKKVTDSSSTSTEDEGFNYTQPFMSDVWVYKVNTGDGYKYEDISQKNQEEAEGESALQYITFIGDAQKMIEIQNRSTKGKLAILGRLDESEDCDTLGHVIGDYTKIFSGYVDVETGKMNLEQSK